jgi:hypothetical protein
LRAVRKISLGRAIAGSQGAGHVFCLLLAFSAMAFAPAPFSRWARGEITAVDPAASTFNLREGSSAVSRVFHWTDETRLWIEPFSVRDAGAVFDSNSLAIGMQVRVMFKKWPNENRVSRVIRLASGAEKGAKKK